MNGKANAVNIITFLIAMIGAYTTMFGVKEQAVLGIIGMALSTVLATFATNGTWVKGWSTTLWVTTVAGVVIQLLNAVGAAEFMKPSVVTGIVTGINVFINVFYKSYDGNDTLSERKLV